MFQSFEGTTTCFRHGSFGKQHSVQLATCRIFEAAVKDPGMLRILPVKRNQPALQARSFDRFSIGGR